MSKKRRNFSAEFKTKVVLELLEGDKTLNQIASKYEILPKSLQQWKKQFLDNATLAFDKSVVVKEYKEEIERLKKEKDATYRKLGEAIVERNFVVGKLKSLVSCKSRQESVDTEHSISLNKQLKLLSLSKSSYYYKPVKPFSKPGEVRILNLIDEIHTNHPYYGARRVSELLKRLGFCVVESL